MSVVSRLTAFVMKSFGGARDYIYVDPQHIKDARTWLSGLQKSDGCFTSVGKLFHNSMKVRVSQQFCSATQVEDWFSGSTDCEISSTSQG